MTDEEIEAIRQDQEPLEAAMQRLIENAFGAAVAKLSIPAEEEDDDLVVSRAVRLTIPALLAEVKRLQKRDDDRTGTISEALTATIERQAALLARCRRVLRSTRSVLGQPHRAADVDAWWGIQDFARGRVRDLLKALGDDDD